MTIQIPPAAIHLTSTPVQNGCVTCGSQITVRLSPIEGRQCSDHVTVPAGAFDRSLIGDMLDLGRADAAWNYLRAYLAGAIDDRYATAAASLTRTDTTGDER